MAGRRTGGPAKPERIRIDKWLWHARVARTRPAAGALCEAGDVRVNGQRIDRAHFLVGVGDVVTIGSTRSVRVLRIVALAERRGSATAAATLFEDLSPAPATTPQPPDLARKDRSE